MSDARLRSSTPRARVNYRITDAAILQPTGFTSVQELELPSCIELTHFGHDRPISNTRLDSLCIVHLLKAFQEVNLAFRERSREQES